jgi:hypothetical protein
MIFIERQNNIIILLYSEVYQSMSILPIERIYQTKKVAHTFSFINVQTYSISLIIILKDLEYYAFRG